MGSYAYKEILKDNIPNRFHGASWGRDRQKADERDGDEMNETKRKSKRQDLLLWGKRPGLPDAHRGKRMQDEASRRRKQVSPE